MNDGGPAFPVAAQSFPEGGGIKMPPSGGYLGMSLRDYFAAAALPQIMQLTFLRQQSGVEHASQDVVNWASHAYKIADALLGERIK